MSIPRIIIPFATLLVLTTAGCSDPKDPSPTLAPTPATEQASPHESENPAPTGDIEKQLADAVAKVRVALGSALKSALAEGPESAIDVCRVEAPRLAKQASTRKITVGRTSHRLRNAANAPAPWMLPFLAEFDALDAAPGRSRSIDLGESGTGYVEAIYTQGLCLTCHGENVAPALLEKIRTSYPEDAAIGFRAGELRGLFWAVSAEQTL